MSAQMRTLSVDFIDFFSKAGRYERPALTIELRARSFMLQ
jgi:hypothetical protein